MLFHQTLCNFDKIIITAIDTPVFSLETNQNFPLVSGWASDQATVARVSSAQGIQGYIEKACYAINHSNLYIKKVPW